MELMKQRTIAGMTFFYTTEEELRQKAGQALVKTQAEAEMYERELENLDSKVDTLRFAANAIQVLPWLGKLLGFKAEASFMDQEAEQRYLSLKQAAAYLGLSPKTLYAWAEDREIPGHKVGRVWRFDRQELDQF